MSIEEFTPLTPPEKKRTYHFPNGESFSLYNVTHFLARPSGTHRLKTGEGLLHVVPTGWLHIEIDVEDWTL